MAEFDFGSFISTTQKVAFVYEFLVPEAWRQAVRHQYDRTLIKLAKWVCVQASRLCRRGGGNRDANVDTVVLTWTPHWNQNGDEWEGDEREDDQLQQVVVDSMPRQRRNTLNTE